MNFLNVALFLLLAAIFMLLVNHYAKLVVIWDGCLPALLVVLSFWLVAFAICKRKQRT